MKSDDKLEPLHLALQSVAQLCISESLLEEAEVLHTFLSCISAPPRFTGLLNLWIQVQKGDMRAALRDCKTLAESNADSAEITALLALLSHVGKDPQWRLVCENLLEKPDCPEDSRRLVNSLLDGSFGRKKADEPQAVQAVDAAQPTSTVASSFDMSSFLRA